MVKRLMLEGETSAGFTPQGRWGTMTLADSLTRPVETILSGPAASLMGARALTKHQHGNAVIVDIGGTTTDIAVQAAGEPVFQPQGAEIAGHKTLVPALFVRSIGLGGDSEIRLVRQGKAARAVNSSSSDPGGRYPATLGGSRATPTDAAVVLGLTSIGDVNRAREV